MVKVILDSLTGADVEWAKVEIDVEIEHDVFDQTTQIHKVANSLYSNWVDFNIPLGPGYRTSGKITVNGQEVYSGIIDERMHVVPPKSSPREIERYFSEGPSFRASADKQKYRNPKD